MDNSIQTPQKLNKSCVKWHANKFTPKNTHRTKSSVKTNCGDYYPLDGNLVSPLSHNFIVHLFQLKIRVFASWLQKL